MLKLSINIKYNFPHIWECRYSPVLKGIHIPTKMGNINISDIWISLGDLQPNIRMLWILITLSEILKRLPHTRRPESIKIIWRFYKIIVEFLIIKIDYLFFQKNNN